MIFVKFSQKNNSVSPRTIFCYISFLFQFFCLNLIGFHCFYCVIHAFLHFIVSLESTSNRWRISEKRQQRRICVTGTKNVDGFWNSLAISLNDLNILPDKSDRNNQKQLKWYVNGRDKRKPTEPPEQKDQKFIIN